MNRGQNMETWMAYFLMAMIAVIGTIGFFASNPLAGIGFAVFIMMLAKRQFSLMAEVTRRFIDGQE